MMFLYVIQQQRVNERNALASSLYAVV